MAKPEREWVGGRYTLPDEVEDGDAVIQPDVYLWLELPAGDIVGSFVVNPAVASFSESLAATMAEPLEGEPRRPSSIRVADDLLARELRHVAAGIPVTVAPVPELDAAFVDFCELFEESEGSYLGEGDIAIDAVEEFFAASAELFRAEPWRNIYDKQAMRVDIPHHGIDGGVLSVIGAAGESFGLLLFRSMNDFVEFTEGRRGKADGQVAMRSVSFADSKIVPPPMLAEIERHHWTIAGDDAIPMVFVTDASLEPLEPTELDMRVLSACTRAFLAFYASHNDLFENEEPEVVRAPFTAADNTTVTITAPYIDDES